MVWYSSLQTPHSTQGGGGSKRAASSAVADWVEYAPATDMVINYRCPLSLSVYCFISCQARQRLTAHIPSETYRHYQSSASSPYGWITGTTVVSDAWPVIRLPSQLQRITGHWPVPQVYCFVTEAHLCEQLAQSCTWKRDGRELNVRPADHRFILGAGTVKLSVHSIHRKYFVWTISLRQFACSEYTGWQLRQLSPQVSAPHDDCLVHSPVYFTCIYYTVV